MKGTNCRSGNIGKSNAPIFGHSFPGLLLPVTDCTRHVARSVFIAFLPLRLCISVLKIDIAGPAHHRHCGVGIRTLPLGTVL